MNFTSRQMDTLKKLDCLVFRTFLTFYHVSIKRYRAPKQAQYSIIQHNNQHAKKIRGDFIAFSNQWKVSFETFFWYTAIKQRFEYYYKNNNYNNSAGYTDSDYADSYNDLYGDYNIGKLHHMSRKGVDDRVYFGIELDGEHGDYNGCIGDTEYFQYADNYGIFILKTDIKTVIKQQVKEFVNDKVEINRYGIGKVKWIGNLPGERNKLFYGVECGVIVERFKWEKELKK